MIGVVIPSKSNFTSLVALLEQIFNDGVDVNVVVMDNGYEPALQGGIYDWVRRTVPFGSKLQIIRDETPSIYHLWNAGYEQCAIADGCPDVAFLNDDITLIGEDWLQRLVNPLWVAPRYAVTCPDWTKAQPNGLVKTVRGTYREQGMCGFAFAINVNSRAVPHPPFDEDYSWWYGDDDFVEAVTASGGKIGRVGGLHLEHRESTTINTVDVSEAIAVDTELWEGRHA